MRMRWIVVAVLVAGCGGQEAKPKPVNADGAIREVVQRSYNSTDVRDCGKLFTTAFLRDVYRGRTNCEKSVPNRTLRTVRVTAIRRQGPVADARIRMNGVDATVKMVLTGRQWRVDDVVGADGSARNNLEQSHKALKRIDAETPKPLGTVESFKPLAKIGPKSSFDVQVLDVIPGGHTRTGMKTGYGQVANPFGAVTAHVKFRVVNIRVRLTATGPKPFKGTLNAYLMGTHGRRWPDMQHTGRLPDWSDGESTGIKPGHSVTRWLSFGLPVASQPKVVEIQPALLVKQDTIVLVEPEAGRWRTRPSA